MFCYVQTQTYGPETCFTNDTLRPKSHKNIKITGSQLVQQEIHNGHTIFIDFTEKHELNAQNDTIST